jgi:hypothetical protein
MQEQQTPFKTWKDNFRIAATRISKYAAYSVFWSLLQAAAVQFLWNFTIPMVLQFSGVISYGQAFALVLLCRILSRTWVRDGQRDLAMRQLAHLQYIDNAVYSTFTLIHSQVYGPPQEPQKPTQIDKASLN